MNEQANHKLRNVVRKALQEGKRVTVDLRGYHSSIVTDIIMDTTRQHLLVQTPGPIGPQYVYLNYPGGVRIEGVTIDVGMPCLQ